MLNKTLTPMRSTRLFGFLVLVVTMALTSCTQDYDLDVTTSTTPQTTCNNRLSQDEAVAIATDAVNSLGVQATRAGKAGRKLTVESIRRTPDRGQTRADGQDGTCRPLFVTAYGGEDGCTVGPKCMGTYIHGALDNAEFVDILLSTCGKSQVSRKATVDYAAIKESQYDLLANCLRRHLDIGKIYDTMKKGK